MAEGSVEEADDEPRIPSVHSSYHGSFFLLRTPVTVHGAQAHVTLDKNRSPSLTLPFSKCQNCDVLLSSVSHLVGGILSKHGAYHVDTFYYEDVPLFSVTFDSQTSLKRFLKCQDVVSNEIQNAFAKDIASPSNPRARKETPSFYFPHHPPLSLPPVDVSVELYHITPDHQHRTAQVELVTLSSYEHAMTQWRGTEFFSYHSIFAGAEIAKVKWLREEKVLTIDNFREVLATAYQARKCWYWIGVELHLSVTDLDSIHSKEDKECLKAVLKTWLKQRGLRPTWSKLVKALKSELVGEQGVACDIETYIQQKAGKDTQSLGVPSAGHILKSTEEQPHSLQGRGISGNEQAVKVTEEQVKLAETNLQVLAVSKDITRQELELAARDLPGLQKIVHRLIQEKSEIEEELEERRKTRRGLCGIVDVLEKKEKRYKEELVALRGVVEEKNEQIIDLEAQLYHNIQALSVAEGEIQKVKDQLQAKSDELEMKTNEAIKLNRTVKQLKGELELQKKAHDAEQKLMAAKEESYEAQLKELKVQVSEAAEQEKSKERESNRLQTAIDKLSKETTAKKEEMDKLQEELESLRAEASSSKEMRASFERETRALRISLQMAELRARLLHDNEEREKLQQEKDQAVAEMEYLRRTIEMRHVSPHNCQAMGPGLESAEKHKLSQFQILLYDRSNEPFTGVGEHTITTKLRRVSDNLLGEVTLSSESTAVYIANYTPKCTGRHELSVNVNGTPIHGSPFHLLVINHPHPSNCTAEGSGVQRSGHEKHRESSFTLHVMDEDGEPCATSQTITTELMSIVERSVRVTGKAEYNVSDTCVISYTPTKAGEHELSVKVNDTPIHESPFHLFVVNHPHPDNCTAEGIGLEESEKHRASSFTVRLQDEDGEPCVTSHTITTELKSLMDRSIRVTNYTIADGDVVSYIPRKAGEHELSVKVNDTPIHGSPSRLLIANHPHPSNCTAYGIGLGHSEKHKKSSFTVCLRDEDGEPCITPWAIAVELRSLMDESIRIMCEIKYRTPDTCEVSYTPTKAGEHELSVKVNNIPICGSPFRLFVANHPHPSNCTAEGSAVSNCEKHKTSSFMVHLNDEDGEPCVTANYIVTAELRSLEDRSIRIMGEIIYKTLGTCKISYTPTQCGLHELTIEVNGTPIQGSPFPVAVYVVDHPHPPNCIAEGTNTGVTQKRSSLLIHLRNKHREPCVSTRKNTITVHLRSVVNKSVRCEVKPMTANPATYEVFYTPSVRGRYEFDIHVEGVPIQGCPICVYINHPLEAMVKHVRSLEILVRREMHNATGVAVTSEGMICIRVSITRARDSFFLRLHQRHAISGTEIMVINPYGTVSCSWYIRDGENQSSSMIRGIEIDDGDTILCNISGFVYKYDLEGHELKRYRLPGFRADFITLSKNKRVLFVLDRSCRMITIDTDLVSTDTCCTLTLPAAAMERDTPIYDIACDNGDRLHVLFKDRYSHCKCGVFTINGQNLYTLSMSALDGVDYGLLRIDCTYGRLYVVSSPATTSWMSETLGGPQPEPVHLYAFATRDKTVEAVHKIGGRFHTMYEPAIALDCDGFLVVVSSPSDFTCTFSIKVF